jgi:hypothetical protein
MTAHIHHFLVFEFPFSFNHAIVSNILAKVAPNSTLSHTLFPRRLSLALSETFSISLEVRPQFHNQCFLITQMNILVIMVRLTAIVTGSNKGIGY